MNDNSNILQDLVTVLKKAQTTGSLPALTVNTEIKLDNATILKTGAALFGAILLAGLICVVVNKNI